MIYQNSLYFFRNKKWAVLAFFLFCEIVKGQEVNHGVLGGFKSDTVTVKAGQTFANSFWVLNQKNIACVLVSENNALYKNNALLRLPDTIRLKAGEKKWFPLKYIANRETILKNFQDITVSLKDVAATGSKLVSGTFIAHLVGEQQLFIETDQQEVYLNQLTNQARVMVRLFNNGLIPLIFNLELSEIPDGLDFTGESMHIVIQPGQQLMLPFIAKNKLNSRLPADFAVTIRAVDQTGAEMGLKRLRIMSVSSDRRLSLNQSPFYEFRPNTIALRYMQVDKSLSAYQLQGSGRYTFGEKNQLDYQLNAEYFNNPGQKGLNLYDSYIHYDNGILGFQLGSVYESMDFNVNGQGLKATAHLNKTNSINVYGLNNKNFIYSDFNNTRAGQTYAISYKQEEGGRNVKNLVLLHNSNSYTKLKTTLLSGSINVPLNQFQRIGLEGGLSQEFPAHIGGLNKKGAAFGLNYQLNFKNSFILNSSNYYSSPYYAGLRRGLLQLDNNISLELEGLGSLNARISLMENNPGFLTQVTDGYRPLTSSYGSQMYELGLSRRVGKLNLKLAPYYYRQYMATSQVAGNNISLWRSAALRARLNASYSYYRHEFSLESDNGYMFRNQPEKPRAPFFSSRATFNYRNQVLGFTAFGQLNSYYLTDAVGISESPKYVMYSLGPDFHFALLNRTLTFNGNISYNYYGFNRSENYSFNGNLRWQLRSGWAISADMYYGSSQQKIFRTYDPTVSPEQQNQLYVNESTYRFQNRQIRLGIEKSFGRSFTDNSAKLEMLYFEDKNGNGVRDNGEPVVPGILVKVDGLAAITDEQGKVRFTGTKGQKYDVAIVNNNGWTMLYPIELTLLKNIKLEAALVKKEKLSGSLSFMTEKYKEGKPNLEGIRIKATANNGLSFETITDEKGAFSFYLPANNYIIYVDNRGLPFSVMNPKETVSIAGTSKPRTLQFICKDEERQVEVVKF